MNDKPKCCAKVWDAMWRRHKPCSRSGKIERDGKWYCGTHDPVAFAKAAEERDAKFQVEFEKRIRRHRLNVAAPELLEALEAIVALSDRDHKAWDKARAVIAKAKGGKA